MKELKRACLATVTVDLKFRSKYSPGAKYFNNIPYIYFIPAFPYVISLVLTAIVSHISSCSQKSVDYCLLTASNLSILRRYLVYPFSSWLLNCFANETVHKTTIYLIHNGKLPTFFSIIWATNISYFYNYTVIRSISLNIFALRWLRSTFLCIRLLYFVCK